MTKSILASASDLNELFNHSKRWYIEDGCKIEPILEEVWNQSANMYEFKEPILLTSMSGQCFTNYDILIGSLLTVFTLFIEGKLDAKIVSLQQDYNHGM